VIPEPPRSRQPWRIAAWVAGASAVGYVIYLLVSGLLTPPLPPAPNGNQMVMRGIESEGRHGKTYWHFAADSSEISPDGYTTTYHNVHDATYYRDGKATYKMTASVVTVDSRNQNYSASGGVHIWSVLPGRTEDFRTEDAFWNDAAQLLTCSTPTRVVYRGSAMHTSGMTVDLRTGAAQMGITSIDYLKPSPTPTSTSR
jgi:LPS export ABC transporter protein LptC